MWSLPRIRASKHDPNVNSIFTISIQPELASEAYAYQKPPPFRPGGGFFKFRGGETSMLAGNVRPDANLLSAFALAIVGALVAGLPMALFIIWACS
jgi:hypothetical protein